MIHSKSELLAHIRGLQKALDGLMDIVIAMEDSEPQPVQAVQHASNDDWLTAKQTCKCLKISETTFYDYIKQGLLPPGLKLGPRAKRWKMSDIEAYQRRRCAEESSRTPAKKRGRPSSSGKGISCRTGAFVHV